MNAVVDTSILSFFVDAGAVVKTVMVILLLASLLSWTLIFQRGLYLRQLRQGLRQFEDKFWAGTDLSLLFRELNTHQSINQGVATIFHAGFKEFLRLRQLNFSPAAILEGSERAMRIADSKEVDHLEQNLSLLATIGSTSPYVGLFGTVWGIMTAFQALGAVQQATVAMVAPGISEALIATAMGLFAAIPAVIAYNRYSYHVERMANQYQSFQEELLGILSRQLQHLNNAGTSVG